MRPPRALVLDMDGTLLDNMGLHAEAWRRWHDARGLPFEGRAFFRATAGRTGPEVVALALPGLGPEEARALNEEKEALYRALLGPRPAPLPGLDALLDAAAARGLPLAIASAGEPANADLVLDGIVLAGRPLRARFAAVVTPSRNPLGRALRGKPEPDLFLAAAEALGVAPADCLAFEDAPLGVEAARRAGMRAVALTTSAPAGAFAHLPNVAAVAADFRGLDLPALLGAAP